MTAWWRDLWLLVAASPRWARLLGAVWVALWVVVGGWVTPWVR